MKESFEENIKRLEEIVRSLEGGDVKLDESIQLFEEGVQLTKHLQKTLDLAEGKIKILTDENSNTFEEFEVKNNE